MKTDAKYVPAERQADIVSPHCNIKAISQFDGCSIDTGMVSRWMLALVVVSLFLVNVAPSAFARGAPENLADLAEALSPAVVNISTEKVVDMDSAQSSSNGGRVPFDELFNDFQDSPNGVPQTTRKEGAQGSGFIIDAKGTIITNYHVIDGADLIKVSLNDGTSFEATIIGSDEKTDLAVLKIKSDTPLPALEFANSDTARVGNWVMAIGNPFGLGGTVTAGIVSARNRDFEGGGPYANFIQTDASINQGNSGGPLFDLGGKVVGVNTAIFSTTGGSIGIGFAIPSNQVQKIVAQILKFGEVRRGWLGARVQEMTDDIALSMGMKKAAGALVLEVKQDGPAMLAGILPGDVILNFNGDDINSMRDLSMSVADAKIGKDVDVNILRNEKKQNVYVKIKKIETEPVLVAEVKKPADPEFKSATETMGLKLVKLTPRMRERFTIDAAIEGVLVVAVDRTSTAWGRIHPGDVIQTVSQHEVSSPKSVAIQVKATNNRDQARPVLLMLNRAGNRAFVAVQNKQG